ncbi:alanine racemase [Amycolatopsis cynarae]|uniref:Alanine racemase n=1 Tax=Amycolatopsis cynarae TaxID=2995223 RepID=A0ABY7AY80_9PSEU|nr:alanine racemase [Amycolatopsis sp. HUAS 11-8]WAL64679.1 alanine racemase [Amycolatopsis sp. HUAS 11-8]
MTSTLGISRPGCAGLLPPTLQTIPESIGKNIAIARTRTRSRIMAVVKADGYGHGAITVARAAIAAGADWLGTTDLAEASRLRAAGLTAPILTWLNPSGVDAEAAATGRIDIAVGSVDELEALLKQSSPTALRVHLHLDTGMAREGCPVPEWDALIAGARQGERQGKVRVVGLMGHLPLADRADPEANAPAVSRLRQAGNAVTAAGLEVPLTHLAATSGTLTDPATHFGMVRLGAGLVGIDPSETTELHGASRLTAPVVHSATVEAGTPVGYGGTYVTGTSANLSVLPLGYADGIPREISPDASVEIHGRRHRVVGRVSMDQIVIDTGADHVPLGTTATVFGPPDGIAPTIRDWARWAGTIPHTIVTGIGPRVNRTIA